MPHNRLNVNSLSFCENCCSFPAENTAQVARNIMPAQAAVPFRKPVKSAFNVPASSSRAALFANQPPKPKAKIASIEETSPKNMDWGEKQLTKVGLEKPVTLESGEIGKVLEWQDYRNKFLKKLSETDISGFDETIKVNIKSIKNNIRDHFTPDDLAALFKENRGVPIYNDKGVLQNHKREYHHAANGISNGLKSLKKRLNYLEEKKIEVDSDVKETEFLREFVKEGYGLLGIYVRNAGN